LTEESRTMSVTRWARTSITDFRKRRGKCKRIRDGSDAIDRSKRSENGMRKSW